MVRTGVFVPLMMVPGAVGQPEGRQVVPPIHRAEVVVTPLAVPVHELAGPTMQACPTVAPVAMFFSVRQQAPRLSRTLTPLRCHWKVSLLGPLALTMKVRLDPAVNSADIGWPVIVGRHESTTMRTVLGSLMDHEDGVVGTGSPGVSPLMSARAT